MNSHPKGMGTIRETITNSFLAVIVFLVMTIIIVISATFFSYLAYLFLTTFQNYTIVDIASFVNQNSSNFVSVFTNVMLTLGLIFFSALSLSSANKTLKQSKEQQEQLQDEQRIRDIEKRLEKFYIPANDILNFKHRSREYTVNGYKRNTDGQFVQGLQHLRKYSYLANKLTYKAYEKYMSEKCTTEKPITCQDIYKNLNFNECENYVYNCHNNWSTCPHNLEYCKYHPDRGKSDNNNHKDKNKCTLNNTNCKYINDLKEKIENDIEVYKNELLELKK